MKTHLNVEETATLIEKGADKNRASISINEWSYTRSAYTTQRVFSLQDMIDMLPVVIYDYDGVRYSVNFRYMPRLRKWELSYTDDVGAILYSDCSTELIDAIFKFNIWYNKQ